MDTRGLPFLGLNTDPGGSCGARQSPGSELSEGAGVEGGARALAGLQVNYDEEQKEVTIVADVIDHQASVEVNAPLKFGK